ncbi:MAG: glutathione synthase [Proteobacteria bacterium]|nr:glutathione synthase [Pseudomonadota bacterium]
MTIKLGVIMDPIESIKPRKDSTLAMLEAAQRKGWSLYTINPPGLYITDSEVYAHRREIRVRNDPQDWFEVVSESTAPMSEFDLVLLRKDPPFDMEYVYLTYMLELVEAAGVPVANRPGSVRDCNEKLFALKFPSACPPHIVSRDAATLKDFAKVHQDVVFKPLDGMGGSSIFRVKPGDKNLGVIIETLTAHGTRQAMAQRFIPEIVSGDTRILLINGEPVPYGLARIPSADENRGNLAAGGEGVGRELTDRDREICNAVGPVLVEKGLFFVGIDVIGKYLTEINVTCPTCIREIDRAFGTDIATSYLDFLEQRFC